jgi:hypothetical protein
MVFVEDTGAGDQGTINQVVFSIQTESGVVDRVEPFVASYDLFITRSDGRDMLLLNDGTGKFTDASGRLPTRPNMAFEPSYDAAVGNVYLRTRRETHGANVIDRPFVDIVVGRDQQITAANSNSVGLLVNDASNPGTFIDATHEVPQNRLTFRNGAPENDIVSGNIRTVRLGDVDLDGDLDMFLGQFGRFTTTFVGATDWLYVNRVVGENELAQTRPPLFRAPGTPTLPVVSAVSPAEGALGDTLTVQVYGAGLRNGTQVDFGQGIQVLQYASVAQGRMNVRIHIAPDAQLGPRSVDVIDPMGIRYEGAAAVFQVQALTQGSPATAWDLYQ